MIKETVVWDDGFARCHLKDAWSLLRTFIAWLGIFLLMEDRLELRPWTALHIIHIALLCDGLDPVGGYISAVGTPLYARTVVE